MRLFQRKQPRSTAAYDRARLKPAMRCSICTGEQVAGFRELDTGRFQDLQLIRTPEDLNAFCDAYGVDPKEIEKIY